MLAMSSQQLEEAAAGKTPDVVVIVGTDHHPFDRLITWVNNWLSGNPEHVSRFFVQWGAASTRPNCSGAQFVSTDELRCLLRDVSVIICHGGGGSMSDAWALGHVPIVVPRIRRLGEHVDDHQIDFSGKLAELGRVRLARTETGFANLLDKSLCDIHPSEASDCVPIGSTAEDVEQTVARLAALVDELVYQPRRRFSLRIWKSPESRSRGSITPPLAPADLPLASPRPRRRMLGSFDGGARSGLVEEQK
jgi:UDP-N-acetylglucosamine transferase subunit ALG13